MWTADHHSVLFRVVDYLADEDRALLKAFNGRALIEAERA
jgi:hypothetical protein